jgi:hypothetical protein
MNKEIEKYTKEMVAYMSDELCLEGLPSMQSGRAAQLSSAAETLKNFFERGATEKLTESKLISLEDEIENMNDKRGCLLWKRTPAV